MTEKVEHMMINLLEKEERARKEQKRQPESFYTYMKNFLVVFIKFIL